MSNLMKLCKCGCGQYLLPNIRNGREINYIHGHNRRNKAMSSECKFKIGNSNMKRHFTDKIRPKICKMYLEKEMTCQQIADELGTGRDVIIRRLKEEGVKIKGVGGFRKGKPLSAEHVRKCLRRRIPTSLEKKFLKIVEENGLPYKYVGDGSFMISNKNPDFININGRKIAIEVYAEFYKTLNGRNIEEWRTERKELFKEYGWDLLFFSQTQVREDYVLNVLGCS